MGDGNQIAGRLAGLALQSLVCFPMALRAAINLKVFEIIDQAGAGASLSPSEIVAKIPTTNPNASAALERILRVLVANSLLMVSYREGEKKEAVYGLASWATSLVPGTDGVSAAAEFLLSSHEATVAGLYHLEDAVMEEGCLPFEKAHGTSLYEFAAKDKGYTKAYHEAMSNISAMVMAEVFAVYNGFEQVKEIIDVGGGVGTCVSMIVSKYPHIRGINFDLPYAIANAPQYPGVVHIEGDVFEAVPKAETALMKSLLHHWNDEECVKLLRNCWEALPEGGKVIALEFVVPPELGKDTVSLRVTSLDLLMMACSVKGKERSLEELRELSEAAGFAELKNFPVAHGLHVVEFHKGVNA
ncbi:(S)-scoulerine 9-O-methyltransferase-like [Aristolochia californica]|uniref:(S)-scoulerine 9-O-methyltransferase-like n=1 Tax=Aristolochia californica TaxID=171875 RepID=UPI0035DC5B31